MSEMILKELTVNGQLVNAVFEKDKVENRYLPLLKKLTNMQKEKQKRLIVFMAGAPGSGKTTLSYYLQELSKENPELTDLQAIGIDGYHFYNAYLKSHTCNINGTEELLSAYKGASFTFDVEHFMEKLNDLCEKEMVLWPLYSRVLHEPEEDKIEVTADIILIEGNYLLSEKEPWSKAKDYADYLIYVDIDKEEVKQRLINRKMVGGLSLEEAIEFYYKSDGRNVEDVCNDHCEPDVVL